MTVITTNLWFKPKKDKYKPGEKIEVWATVKNNGAVPVFTHPIKLWAGKNCSRISVIKTEYIPVIWPGMTHRWHFKQTVPERTLVYAYGVNTGDEGNKVKHCRQIKIKYKPSGDRGRLNITTSPKAKVYVDDEYIGISPTSTVVDYGSHKVVARKKGYEPAKKSVEISSKEKKVHLVLHKKKPEPKWKRSAIAGAIGIGIGIAGGYIARKRGRI